jgi:hypothetical protein
VISQTTGVGNTELTQNLKYPRSIETMLNGRGYTSYEHIDDAQTRLNRFYAIARLFT